MTKLSEMFVAQDEQQRTQEQQQRIEEKTSSLMAELKTLSMKKDENGHYSEEVAKRIMEITDVLNNPTKIIESVDGESQSLADYMKGFKERRCKNG